MTAESWVTPRALPTLTVTLQRSRGPMTAESRRSRGARSRARGASTEPRSDDRGEDRLTLEDVRRVIASTEPRSDDRGECHGCRRPPRPHCPLQRSRGPMTAESWGPGSAWADQNGASTEPRSDDRGEPASLVSPPGSPSQIRFNGAAVR